MGFLKCLFLPTCPAYPTFKQLEHGVQGFASLGLRIRIESSFWAGRSSEGAGLRVRVHDLEVSEGPTATTTLYSLDTRATANTWKFQHC